MNTVKRSAFFHNSTTGQRAKKRAPLVMDDRQRALRQQKLQAQFANAADAIGSNLAGLFSVPLRTALGINPDDSDDVVKNKIVNQADTLDSTQTADLFAALVSAIQRGTGSAQTALAKARDLFPQLLAMAAPGK